MMIEIIPIGDLKSKSDNWGYRVVRNDYNEAEMIAKLDGEYFRLLERIDPLWDSPNDLGKEKIGNAEMACSILEKKAREYASRLGERSRGE